MPCLVFWISAALCLALAGCAPSCTRVESRTLFPSDSLSRGIADATAVDTLALRWESAGPEASPLAYPRTVAFDADGRLYVSDAEAHAVHAYDADGRPLFSTADPAFAFPYLAGTSSDTVAVFSPAAHAVQLRVGKRLVATVPTPSELPAGQPLQYAAYGPGGLFVKILGEDSPGYLARLEVTGAVRDRWPLDGPLWRHAGKLAAWGDTLLSACGYRPVVDLFRPGTPRDTLVLAGFDSPMLARSRSFVLGDVHDPPLLSSAFAPAGDRLFVLNLRPGWLWIDVYDRAGRLQRHLVQASPGFAKEYYPVDIAVHPTADSTYEIAVALTKPIPSVMYYRWRIGGDLP
jgi:hypothetical protein